MVSQRDKELRAEMFQLWLKHRELMVFNQDWGFERAAKQNYRIATMFWRLWKEMGDDNGSTQQTAD